MPLPDRSPRSKEDLNWCDRAELEENLNLFDEKQQHLIHNIIRKQDQFPEGFSKGNYFKNIYPIIASGYTSAEQIVYCGAQHTLHRRPCRRWQFCSRCARFKGSNSLRMYRSAFKESNFHHLTCSFNGGLALNSTNTSDMQTYWKAIDAAVLNAVNDRIIDGACVVHEISIRQFLNLRVLPHSHVLVSGDAFDATGIADSIAAIEGVNLDPSLVSKPINDVAGFSKVIYYQTEEMDLTEAYNSALLKHGRQRLRDLNLEMREFLDSYSASIHLFRRIRRMGNLQPQKGKAFIGNKDWRSQKLPRMKYTGTRIEL